LITFEALIVVALSPFVGSFLGVVIDRLPAGRPIIVSRSTCDRCGHRLRWFDLIPVVSFFWLRARCRDCDGRINPFYPFIECAAVLVALSAVTVLSGWLLYVSVVLGWALLTLALIDYRHLILPDGLTLPLIPAGLGVAYLVAPEQMHVHVIGMAAGLLVFLTIAWTYRSLRGRDGLGIGDAKLLSGAGAWLGWPALPGVVLLASVTALCLALLQILTRDRMAITHELPFGPHLAFAFWASWLLGPLILA
jgi:leader peptidase (prepilin peptidase)/N-methyltransferase